MREIINQDVAAFHVKTQMPTEWDGQPTSVTADIVKDGVNIETDLPVNIYTGDTLAVKAYHGQKVCTLATGNTINDGEFIQIGSPEQGWYSGIVDGFTATTKQLRFKPRLDEDKEADSVVAGRTMQIEIDTTTDDYDFIGSVVVIWKAVGISAIQFTQSWKVLKRTSASGGLEQRFSMEFKDFWPHVDDGQFVYFEQSAVSRIKQNLNAHERDLDKIIDSSEYDLLKMTRIALDIAARHGADFDSQRLKMQIDYDDMLKSILDNYQWDDTNQDLIAQESEVNKGASIAIKRGY